MGLFDTFIHKSACKTCGYPFEYWQTKELSCMMDVYELGDEVNTWDVHTKMVDCKVGVYEWCPECEEMTYALVIIKDGKYVDFELIDGD